MVKALVPRMAAERASRRIRILGATGHRPLPGWRNPRELV